MGTIWIRELVGGLDTRRMPATTSGGVLIKGNDGHINRGGEFEQRAAFVREYTLPASATKGLAAGKTGIYTFGHTAPPTMPADVSYQRIEHPDGVTALARVLSYDLYGGKIYVVGEFADGARYHFYDGVRVPGWFDGRARASLQIISGGTIAAAAAVGSFEVTGGTLSAGVNKFSSIQIDGVNIISAAVDHTGSNSTTASALATAINSYSSSPDYTASATGQTVTITAAATGTAANGKTIVITVGGNATYANVVNMAGGSAAATATLSDLTVGGVSVISAPVVWSTDNTTTAELIATAINSNSSSPDYTATSVGDTVNIIAADAGTAANDRAVVATLINGLVVSPSSGLLMADGADPTPAAAATGSFKVSGGSAGAANKVNNIKINNVDILGSAVLWTTSHADTAAAIAAQINSYVSTPNYTAVASGTTVTITAVTTGPGINGQSIVVDVAGGNVTVNTVQAMSGGADAEATFVPGTFVKTIGSRMHSVSGPNEHFSGISQPTKWTTDTTGAGFIDMSTQESGSEALIALARYQQYVAVFAASVIQVWYFDSDPALNEQKQVLNNTGTSSPRSVTQFGDNDLFYCAESGLRSLRARDASNAAATTDIGVPVDTLVVEKLRSLSETERQQVIGLIEPSDGRFWLIMKDTIFVFSFFSGAKISAWTTYTPGHEVDGTITAFNIEDACVFNRKVYVRSGDYIYVFGGLGSEVTYDSTPAEAWLPYLDGDKPAVEKTITGIDAALEGLWEVRLSMDPNETTTTDLLAYPSETTYALRKFPAQGKSTHFSLRFKSQGQGPHKLGSAVIHYAADEKEDK